jgi:hypothetical protein
LEVACFWPFAGDVLAKLMEVRDTIIDQARDIAAQAVGESDRRARRGEMEHWMSRL